MRIVKKPTILIAAILWTVAPCWPAASDLMVIVNPGFPLVEISAEELRAVFLGTRTSLRNAGQVQPVLKKTGPELAEFAAEYLGKTESALRTYYRSLVFTGKWSMPVTFQSDSDLVNYVAHTPGAIGFVRGTSSAHGVRTLRVK